RARRARRSRRSHRLGPERAAPRGLGGEGGHPIAPAPIGRGGRVDEGARLRLGGDGAVGAVHGHAARNAEGDARRPWPRGRLDRRCRPRRLRRPRARRPAGHPAPGRRGRDARQRCRAPSDGRVRVVLRHRAGTRRPADPRGRYGGERGSAQRPPRPAHQQRRRRWDTPRRHLRRRRVGQMSVAATLPRADPELPRVLAGARTDGGPVGVEAHLDRYGPLPAAGELVDLVAAAGLRGRGGAGFPAARKLQAVRDARRQPVVVANAVEGEPISGKVRALLRHVPHLVLDGAALAAAAVGAREAIVAIGAQARPELEVVRRALGERARRRLDRVPVRLETVPHRFVAGEETALVSWLNGSEPKPTFTPPRPFERGVGGAPTLVQNVETLANLALIARFGAGWFRELGTDEEPGSALVTLSGAVRRPGVYEVGLGTGLRDLVQGAGGLT